jgi:hypothetical protein
MNDSFAWFAIGVAGRGAGVSYPWWVRRTIHAALLEREEPATRQGGCELSDPLCIRCRS